MSDCQVYMFSLIKEGQTYILGTFFLYFVLTVI